MPFHRFVEIGRVVLICYGPHEGKLAVIIDVVDQNKCMKKFDEQLPLRPPDHLTHKPQPFFITKALVDGPETGVPRQMIPFKRLRLTDFKIGIQRNARCNTIIKACKEAGLKEKWEASSWAKKMARKAKRDSMTDFDRFKVMVAKKQKAEIVAKKVAEIKASA